jgi:hypothetical protein
MCPSIAGREVTWDILLDSDQTKRNEICAQQLLRFCQKKPTVLSAGADSFDTKN